MTALAPEQRRAREVLHGFVAAVAAAGVACEIGGHTDFLRAVALAPPASPLDLYWLARVTLVRRLEDVEAFDRVFASWFGSDAMPLTPPSSRPRPQRSTPSRRRAGAAEEVATVSRRQGAGLEASPDDLLGRCVFPPTTEQQLRLLSELEQTVEASLPQTAARRRRAARRGDALDLRRVLRDARRSGGEVLRLHWCRQPRRARRVVLLIDVSGSLRQSSGESLRLAHALVRAAPRAEVYTFGTRLTRVTRQLRARDVDAALEALADLVLDVNGGTRIGAALQELLADGRRASVVRGAVAIVFSDGLERGDPAAMVDAVGRLSRLAHRLVWWSPLACDPGFRPATRAMDAVLGDLDDLAGVRDLGSALEALERLPAVEASPRRRAARRWLTPAMTGGPA